MALEPQFTHLQTKTSGEKDVNDAEFRLVWPKMRLWPLTTSEIQHPTGKFSLLAIPMQDINTPPPKKKGFYYKM